MSGPSLEGHQQGAEPSRATIAGILLVVLMVVAGAGAAILASHPMRPSGEGRVYELFVLSLGDGEDIAIGDVVIVGLECAGPYKGYVTLDLSLVFKADLRDVRIRVYAGYEEKAFSEEAVRRGVRLHYSWSQWGECPLVVVAVEAFEGRG